MDTESLVEQRIDDGQKLITQLVTSGFDVVSACWLRNVEDGEWYLYISSTIVDEKGLAEAYRRIHAALAQLPGNAVSFSEIKLIGASHPLTKEVLALRSRQGRKVPFRFRGQQLGDIPISDSVIYPEERPGLEVIAKGKAEVLGYLEKAAEDRAGSHGEYVLARDSRGNLIAFIAGHSFVGHGSFKIGDNRFRVVDGIVTNVAN